MPLGYPTWDTDLPGGLALVSLLLGPEEEVVVALFTVLSVLHCGLNGVPGTLERCQPEIFQSVSLSAISMASDIGGILCFVG